MFLVSTAAGAFSSHRHPDRHQGNSKIEAEAKFKELQAAYQLLSAPGALHAAARGDTSTAAYGDGMRGASGMGTTARGARQQEWYSKTGAYGAASQPGYNPHTSYTGFGGPKGQAHWYEDTAAAAAKEDQSRMFRSWFGVGLFTLGFLFVTWTSSRDQAAKKRGELVDAWWNQATRRWEKPAPHMFKDPMLSSLIHLKPPSLVHEAATAKQIASLRHNKRKPAKTLDGVNVGDAYRQREQGTRSG